MTFEFSQVLAASIVSLKTIVRVAMREPQPFVFMVLNMTVAKLIQLD